ncbi:hypothetical protein HGA91_05490 [candidate division WWE3 bacterium]|nr:hypothetical protein [candidate division WWE3 bacterium]
MDRYVQQLEALRIQRSGRIMADTAHTQQESVVSEAQRFVAFRSWCTSQVKPILATLRSVFLANQGTIQERPIFSNTGQHSISLQLTWSDNVATVHPTNGIEIIVMASRLVYVRGAGGERGEQILLGEDGWESRIKQQVIEILVAHTDRADSSMSDAA